ncbi:MAG: hypothetical protein GQ534_05355, partial [Candidatus Delongbacteria bacterium]|nr:hypothetical protein [Candidatus Delongbacteria bacterium]
TGFSGNLANGEDVQLSWNTASGAASYDVFKNVGIGTPELLANTTSASYNDNGLSVGLYSYYVRAIYSDGESHNTDSYSAEVVATPGFSSVRSFGADGVGRTNIDLTWDVPFTGVIFFDEDFEAGMTGWVQKQSVAAGVKPPDRSYFKDNLDGWEMIDEAFFGDPQYIHSGLWATGLGYTAGTAGNGAWSWNFTPEFTIPAGGGFVSFWVWYKNNEAEGWYTNIRAYMYQGDFTEQSTLEAEANMSNIFFWEGSVIGEAGNNLYDSEVYIDLAAYAGTYRFAWVYEYTDGYQLCVDDLLCGTTVGGTDLPDEYDVYRNGSLATTVSYTGANELWSDANFIDGENSYYVRAIYPTGSSLVSGTELVTIDANPKPDYLTGVLNGTDIELAWYAPYGTPSHWAAHITPEACTTTIDVLDDTDCAKRRVQFAAADLGLYYPITIDSIAAGFYEWSDDLWGSNNTFVIRLWEGHPINDNVLLWESATLTATAGEVYKVALPTPQVLTGYWNVEVEVFDLVAGHPANLAGPSTSGGTNSYFYYSAETSYNYYVSSGEDALEYCMMSYVTGADPDPIVKVAASGEKVDNPVIGWATSETLTEGIPMINKSGRLITDRVSNTKGVDTYNVYRDGGLIGTTTSLVYTDAPVAEGTYTYEIKTAYVSPAGESAASNAVDVYTAGTGGATTPAVPANVVTSISGSDIVVDWDVSADATGYDVYSSDDPYGTFTFVTSVGTNQYTVAASQAKLFYYIIATN